MTNSLIRIIALSAVLAHLWTGCGCCCAPNTKVGHHCHATWEYCEAADSHSPDCDHHHHDKAPDDDPAEVPCDHSDHGCDYCEYGFLVSTVAGVSTSSISEITQPIPLPSVFPLIHPELFVQPTFNVPSLENVISDPRSLRAQIAVFLL